MDRGQLSMVADRFTGCWPNPYSTLVAERQSFVTDSALLRQAA